MGNKYQVLRHDLQADVIAKYAKIPAETISQMRIEYMSAAQRDGRMTRNDFYNYYASSNSFPHGAVTRDSSDRMFEAIDIDKNGYVTFDEFIIAYSMVHGAADPRDKLQFYIQARYNGQVPQSLTETEMSSIMQSFNTIYQVNTNTSSFVQHTIANAPSAHMAIVPPYQNQFQQPMQPAYPAYQPAPIQQTFAQPQPYGMAQIPLAQQFQHSTSSLSFGQIPMQQPVMGFQQNNPQMYPPAPPDYKYTSPQANMCQPGFGVSANIQQNISSVNPQPPVRPEIPAANQQHTSSKKTTSKTTTTTTETEVSTEDFIKEIVKDPQYARKLSVHVNVRD